MNCCVKCEYCSERAPDKPWWAYLCRHPKRKRTPVLDPVTGRSRYQGVNDLGTTYYTDELWSNCREFNGDGTCSWWSER